MTSSPELELDWLLIMRSLCLVSSVVIPPTCLAMFYHHQPTKLKHSIDYCESSAVAVVKQVTRITAQCNTIPVTCLANQEIQMRDKLHKMSPGVTPPFIQ